MEKPIFKRESVLAIMTFTEILIIKHINCTTLCRNMNQKACNNDYDYVKVPGETLPVCLKLYSQTSKQENWTAAKAKCEADKAQLAKIEKAYENIIVKDHVTVVPIRKKTVWLGLRVLDRNTIKWTDGTPFDKAEFSLLKDNPYHQTLGNQRCLGYNPRALSWQLQDCSEKHAFLCRGKPAGEPDRPSLTALWKNVTRKPGDVLKASCIGYLGGVGKLQFVLLYQDKYKEPQFIGKEAANTTFYGEIELIPTDACTTQAKLSIKFTITGDMNGATFGCISFVRSWVPVCSDRDVYCEVAGVLQVSNVEDPLNKVGGDEFLVLIVFIVLAVIILIPIIGVFVVKMDVIKTKGCLSGKKKKEPPKGKKPAAPAIRDATTGSRPSKHISFDPETNKYIELHQSSRGGSTPSKQSAFSSGTLESSTDGY